MVNLGLLLEKIMIRIFYILRKEIVINGYCLMVH